MISAALLLTASIGGPAAGTPAAPPPLVEVQSETLVVGPGGTRTRASDRALLSFEKPGLLRVEIDLPFGGSPPQQHVSLELRIRLQYPTAPSSVAPDTPPHDPGRPVIWLAVDSTARVTPDGEVVMRSGGGETDLPGSLFYEAYASPTTGERVIVHLKVRPWEEPGLRLPEAARRPRAVHYKVWIYQGTTRGLDLLAAPVLASVVGHAASYQFGFTVGPEGAATREQMSVRLLGIEVRDGILTGSATIEGEMRGESVRRESGWSLEPGETTTVELSLGSVGGEVLGFHVVIVADFDPD